MGVKAFGRIVLTAALCSLLSVGSAFGTELLLQRHQKALGSNCQACHTENPPAKKVPDDKCIGCHGERNALGAKSKSKPNPHSNHVDELYCADCHHVHKPSELYCQQCHDDFDLKVP